jgi:hypothetical protein
MLLDGIMLTLIGPSFLSQMPASALGRGDATGRQWWLAALAIPFLAVAKISAGYAWTAVAGYLALRKMGVRRLSFWLLGLAMAVLFFAACICSRRWAVAAASCSERRTMSNVARVLHAQGVFMLLRGHCAFRCPVAR